MNVLIADDQLLFRETLRLMLQPYGNCVVVEDGVEAVAAFGEALRVGDPFRLVLLDIQMPNLDGQEALLQMRQLEKRHYGPSLDASQYAFIIMQTSLEDPFELLTAFQRGRCNGFINKPVEWAELEKRLKKHRII